MAGGACSSGENSRCVLTNSELVKLWLKAVGRAGGTGEIIYSQAGTRRACGARCDDGRALSKGSEVVVMRYEKGIAYVRLWEELAEEEPPGQERASAEAAGGQEKT